MIKQLVINLLFFYFHHYKLFVTEFKHGKVKV
jgi:hypothetical protein